MIKSNYTNHPDDFIQEEINEHDRQLINKARSLHFTDWMFVNEKAAETVEGYKELHRIASKLYHKEEAYAGEL